MLETKALLWKVNVLNHALVVIVTLCWSASLAAEVIHVPGDFGNIHAAINSAENGDVIQIAAGNYPIENASIDPLGKQITIRGAVDADGLAATVFNATRFGVHVVRCVNGETSGMVLENLVISDAGGWGDGGGMLLLDSSPTIVNCAFNNNHARQGGAIFCQNSNAILEGCSFQGNQASCCGGAIFSYSSGLRIRHCVFGGNSSARGGAVFNDTVRASTSFMSCTFTSNSATGSEWGTGGAMWNIYSSPTFNDCVFEYNAASKQGGGMYNRGGKPVLSDCSFTGNSADVSGGAASNVSSEPVFSNCTFSDNVSFNGGAIRNEKSSPHIQSCFFAGNASIESGDSIFNVIGSTGVCFLSESLFLECCQIEPFQSYVDEGGNFFSGNAYESCDSCRADINCSGIVDAADLAIVLGAWGTGSEPCDINADGIVAGEDLAALLALWGTDTCQ